MTIAVTADVHLKPSYEEAPERFDALRLILDQLSARGIGEMILAGDTYDTPVNNPALLDELLKSYPDIRFYMIPGNHDPNLKPEAFTAPNLTLITSPAWYHLDEQKLPFLFLPYQGGQSMGSALAKVQAEQGFPTEDLPWFLIGHGDYLSSQKPPNPYEPGVYMPITTHDLRRYQPYKVLLGHIHSRHSVEQVHYPGSPCGLDITETGRRYYTLLHTASGSLEALPVPTSTTYFNETLITLPVPHERDYVQQQIKRMKDRWDLSAQEWEKVFLRLRVRGYTKDRQQLKTLIEEQFDGVRWEPGSPDLTAVATQTDARKADLIQQMEAKVEHEAPTLRQLGVPPEIVLEKALHQILNP